MKKQILAVCLLLLTVAAPADTQSYLIRSKFTKGKVQRIKTVSEETITYSKLEDSKTETVMTMQTTSVQKRTVKNIEKDGSAKLDVQIESMKMKSRDSNGTFIDEDLKKDRKFAFAYTVDPRGQTAYLDQKGIDISKLKQKLGNLFAYLKIAWPSNPVKVGDSWTVKDRSLADPSKETDFVFTLMSVESFRGEQAYKIKVEVSFPLETVDQDKTKSSFEFKSKGVCEGKALLLIKASNGELIRSDGEATLTMDTEMNSPTYSDGPSRSHWVHKAKTQQFQLPVNNVP